MTASGLIRIGDVPIYAVDALVRRAPALQRTADAIAPAIYIHPDQAVKLGLETGDAATVTQDNDKVTLPVMVDPAIASGCVRVCAGLDGSEILGGQFGEVTLEKA